MDNNKFTILVISAITTIVLIAGVLIPVIGNATTPSEETKPVAGGYGTVMYQGSPEDYTTYPYRYIQTSYADSTLTVKNGYANALTTIATVDIPQYGDKPLIIYADENATIYIDDDKINFSSSTIPDINGVSVDLGNQVIVAYSSQRGMTYSTGTTNNYLEDKITYYYLYSDNGNYANFQGDNPPAMDTPTVSVAGVYIGEKYTTTTVKPQYATILEVIPIVMLVGLLVAVVTLSIKKQ